MGVKKLLATLQDSRQSCDLRVFAGTRVAVDISCWIHRFGVMADYRQSEESNAHR